jgi:hypothetical protein
LVVTTSTEDTSTGLVGTLSGQCTQGDGISTYDTIYICATGAAANWTTTTKYGVKVADGTTGKLGTKTTAADNNKVSVTTGTAATCTGTLTPVDTGSYSLSIISNDQISVTATVDPLFSFAVSGNTAGFGTFSSTTKRWANTAASGSTTEPTSAGDPATVTVTTNAPNGALVSAKSLRAGLYQTSHTINAVGANSVTSGSEGYAVYVRTAGSNLPAASGFNGTTSTGVISTSFQTIASASGAISTNNTAELALSAAVSGSTTAGSYTDTITLVGTGKF